MSALHAKVTKALAGTTSKHPIMLDQLRKIARPLVDDMQQLYDLLDQLHADSAVQRVSGYKECKPYIAYWEIPNAGNRLQNQFLTSRISTLPASALKAQASATPAAAPAKPTKTEIITMPQKAKPGSITTTLLDHITKHPGKSRADLIKWAVANIAGATETKANSAIGNLCTREQAEASGKRGHLKYYLKGTAPAAGTPATPAPRKPAAQSGAENAVKATQTADLLYQDISALTSHPLPLIRDIAIDLLGNAASLRHKLGLMADHLNQSTQGA